MCTAALVLGDHLFDLQKLPYPKGCPVFMAEDLELCSRYKFHKHKIIFFLSAMREYGNLLTEAGHDLHYSQLNNKTKNVCYLEKLWDFCQKRAVTELVIHEVEDSFFEQRLQSFCTQKKIRLRTLTSPMFLCSRENFKSYCTNQSKPLMKSFYEWQRKDLNILVEKNGQPVGGQWSFDALNRKKLPTSVAIPKKPNITRSKTINDVIRLCDQLFPYHPGDSKDFWLPVTRSEALKWLDEFLHNRLLSFGPYQDALSTRDPFLFHSLLSVFLNSGLLTPDEVVSLTLQYADNNDVPVASVEGFIRQIIGWREFIRGIYQQFSNQMENDNFFSHKRNLGVEWYTGQTTIPLLNRAINKANIYGYCHHIERLMILSNIMLLSEVHPKEAYRWFMEMFIDSADWVMAANVYGMGQFSEGGIFATKPYICGSNYLLKMSDEKKGEWCDIVDGLYWSFIEKHLDFFEKNPRLSMMTKILKKLDPERKKKIFRKADKFRNSFCPY